MNWIIGWTIALVVMAIVEIIGVYRKAPGDTITETVRLWISLIPFAWGRWLAKIVLSGIAAWLILHVWEVA